MVVKRVHRDIGLFTRFQIRQALPSDLNVRLEDRHESCAYRTEHVHIQSTRVVEIMQVLVCADVILWGKAFIKTVLLCIGSAS